MIRLINMSKKESLTFPDNNPNHIHETPLVCTKTNLRSKSTTITANKEERERERDRFNNSRGFSLMINLRVYLVPVSIEQGKYAPDNGFFFFLPINVIFSRKKDSLIPSSANHSLVECNLIDLMIGSLVFAT